MARKEIPLLGVVVLVLIGINWAKHGRALSDPSLTMDAIEFENSDGKQVWRPGEVQTLLVFFRTDCPSCEGSLAAWQELYQEKCKDLRFFFLSPEPWAEISGSWATKGLGKGIDCEPILLGRALAPKTLVDRYQIQAVPTHLFVEADGRVSATLVGSPEKGQAIRLFGGSQ